MHGERPGNGNALLLATGELCRHFVGLLGHAHAAEKLKALGTRLVTRHAQHLDGAHGHVVDDRTVREEVEGLEDHANLSARGSQLLALLRERFPLNEDLARVDGLKTVDGAAERGLAGARGANHHDDLALAYLEVDVLEHVKAAKVLVHVAELDDGGSLCGECLAGLRLCQRSLLWLDGVLARAGDDARARATR